MEAIVYFIHHFLIALIWMYFSHYFLTCKTPGWKRELQMLPVWSVYFLLTSTVLHFEPFIKTTLFVMIALGTFTYIYKFQPFRFIIAVGIICLVSFLSEALFYIYILLVRNKTTTIDITIDDHLFMIPFDFFLHIVIYHWIVHKHATFSAMEPKYITLMFFFLLSQLLAVFLVDVTIMFHSDEHLLAMVILLVISEIICNYLLWKKRNFILLDLQKQKYENQYLKKVYREELAHYMQVKQEFDMHTTLRHDLLNEIQTISYLEQK